MRSRRVVATAVIGALCGFAFQLSGARGYFDRAMRCYEQRQWDEAQANAAKALADDPQMGDAETLLGLIATARSQFAEAEKHFAHAVDLQPQNYQAHGYLGSTYLQQKRLTEAASSFRKVLELNPGNPTANYNLGVIALEQDAPAQALSHFERVTRKNQSDVPALVGTLESELLLHQSQNARQTAGRLEALLDDRDPRLFQIATLLAQHGEAATAVPLMERSRRVFPDSYDVNYNLAITYSQAAQFDLAADALRPFTGPQGKAEAFDLLGTVEEKRGHASDAERAFQEAAQRSTSEDYRFDYGNFLVQHGKLEAAVAALRAAVSDLPNSWKLHIGLGSALYLIGDYESAAEALLDAVRLKPDNASAFFLLGEAYDAAQLHQPAIESAFASYLKTTPRDAWAYYHYAAILYAHAEKNGRDDFRLAAANLKEALRIEPGFAEAYFELGLIALAQGKMDQSVEALEKAASLDPRLAPAHYRLGLAYQRLGNAARSKEEFDRFRSLKNSAPYRGRVLESLASMSR
jgi:tetratricopeptide (TPR) repeat protein